MNLILLFERDFVDDAQTRVRLEGRRARHVRKILRAEPGDVLVVGRVDGPMGEGRVAAMEARSVELDVTWTGQPPPPLDVVLVLALPRPPVLRRTLAQVASLGVKRIALVDSARVEQSFWQSHAIEAEAIEEQIVLGLEQARDTRRPSVTLHRRFGAFVEEALPELVEGRSAWVADAGGASVAAGDMALPGLVAVGPEGGWVSSEVEALEARGLRALTLGERALRVETAVPVLLGRYLH